MNKWFGRMFCRLLHRTGICGDNNTGDLLGLLVSSRTLESSARVARKLPFIVFSLRLRGKFSRTDLLLPCIQLPFIAPYGAWFHRLCSL